MFLLESSGRQELRHRPHVSAGRVTDAADGKALVLVVSVVFPGTTTGITTDEQGIYAPSKPATRGEPHTSLDGRLRHADPSGDARDVQPRGFRPRSRGVRHRAGGHHRRESRASDLDGVIRNKPQNDPDRYDTYSLPRTYTKMELDLTNIKPRFRNKRLQRNRVRVRSTMDTSALTGQAYLSGDDLPNRRPSSTAAVAEFKREVISPAAFRRRDSSPWRSSRAGCTAT